MNECCPHEVQINTSANKIKEVYNTYQVQLTERQKRQGGKEERGKSKT